MDAMTLPMAPPPPQSSVARTDAAGAPNSSHQPLNPHWSATFSEPESIDRGDTPSADPGRTGDRPAGIRRGQLPASTSVTVVLDIGSGSARSAYASAPAPASRNRSRSRT